MRVVAIAIAMCVVIALASIWLNPHSPYRPIAIPRGQMWIDTTGTPNIVRCFDGFNWVSVPDEFAKSFEDALAFSERGCK